MRIGFSSLALLGLLPFLWSGPASAEPKVVASIKPIHSLAAGVMEGVGTPTLLVGGAASEHNYTLRPSDARALSEADVVFLVGKGLETFLTGPLANLAGESRVVELAEVDGIERLPLRRGIDWEAHEHDHAEAAHDPDGLGDGHTDDAPAPYDGHIWLDPDNARRIVAAMAETLSEADPGNAAIYQANAKRLAARITELDRALAAELAPIRDVPYVVFHDAYHYFEKHYGLAAAGSITISPEQPPGARRLSEIRDKIARLQVRCVFAEPQFEPTLVETVREGTAARTGVLDPLGAALPSGPDLYFEVMRGLARSLRGCLAEG